MLIYHIVTPEIWEKFKDENEYEAESLAIENFIHCSYRHQLEAVLERYYKNQSKVLILHINPHLLGAELVAERSTGGEVYPHIYGKINRTAIVAVEESFALKRWKMHENFAEIIKPESDEAELLAAIDPARLPAHIAVIMDGNGRWAKQRGKPRIFGHRAGAESVRAILDTCARLEIKAVTLYAFSTENWKRPEAEVSGLMQMLKLYLKQELKTVHRNNIRFQAIGNIIGLSEDLQKELASAMKYTSGNTGTVLSVALNYGGRAEITEAARRAVSFLIDNGGSIEDLREEDIERNLYTHNLPPVDLLIRTSGEFRISNFLLWQLAYSEIYVTPTLFPDFRRPDIFAAIVEFQKRERRFGGIAAKR